MSEREWLYRDAIALALASSGTELGRLDEPTHVWARSAIDDVMRALSSGGRLSERQAEVEVRAVLAAIRGEAEPVPERRGPPGPLVAPALFVGGVLDAAGEALPRSPARSARLFRGAVELAVAAWGRAETPPPAVLDAACEALASRRGDVATVRARVRELLPEEPEDADPSWRAAVDACRWAPPDAWFPQRLRRLAAAAEAQASAFRAKEGRWAGDPDEVRLRAAYELGSDARPGPTQLWERFDRAEHDLVQLYGGIPVAPEAIAEAFAAVGGASLAIADALL